MRIAMRHLRGLWLTALLAVPFAAQATRVDIAAGQSLTSADRATAAVFASVYGDAPTDGRWHFATMASLGWLGARRTRVEHLHHDVTVAGGGVRITMPNSRWFASEQLVATSTRTDALSSRFEFSTTVGWQRDHFIVMLRHISNGHLVGGGKNLGETMLLVGVRW